MVAPAVAIAGVTGLSATVSIVGAVLSFLGIIFGGPIIRMIVGLLAAFWLVSSGILPPYMAIIILIALVLFFTTGRGR